MKKVFSLFLVVSMFLLTSIFSFTSTETQAATNNNIMGQSILTAQQMADFVKKKNPENNRLEGISVQELAESYLEEGEIEGIRGDVAFAQALKETGYFKYGGDVKPDQNNYTGIGTIGRGVKGNYFKTPEEGVRVQIQHLKAYSSTLKLNNPLIDPRFKYVKRGSAKTWSQLHGKWAMQRGGNYGDEILSIYNEMSKVPVMNIASVKTSKR